MTDSVRTLQVPVRAPFRLDLTANALRRLSTNAVDTFDGDVYRRAFPGAILEVRGGVDALVVTVRGGDLDAESLVRRMFGPDRDLEPFYAAARAVPWLDALVTRARGVKPPRYPALWEAIVNAVVYQQVSIHAAGAILRRVIERYEPARDVDGVLLRAFPSAEIIADADAEELHGLGLSINKVVALRTLARAVLDGELDDTALDPLPTPELTTHLATFRGIGPWTAAVIALRGFGRLDVFPMNDSGVARSLRDLSGDADVNGEAILATLGPQRGMLYYHLLLGRLAARGEVQL